MMNSAMARTSRLILSGRLGPGTPDWQASVGGGKSLADVLYKPRDQLGVHVAGYGHFVAELGEHHQFRAHAGRAAVVAERARAVDDGFAEAVTVAAGPPGHLPPRR